MQQKRRHGKLLEMLLRSFLDNKKDPNYASIVNKMLVACKDLGFSMSLKIHFLKISSGLLHRKP